jgi:putative Holliday junction resolvase
LLGVDYGSVRIGLAVSNAERRLASPLTVYEQRCPERDAEYFRALMEAEEIGAIVVGLPIHCDGREGQKAAEVRSFGAWLAETTGLPVTFWDERFSSVEAESALWQAGLTHKQRKARRDRVAAQILLQAWLDAGCPDDSAAGPLEG